MTEGIEMDKLLTLDEVAEVTRLSVNTLRWLRSQGRGPRAARLGKRLVFRAEEVKAWVDAQFEKDGAA